MGYLPQASIDGKEGSLMLDSTDQCLLKTDDSIGGHHNQASLI